MQALANILKAKAKQQQEPSKSKQTTKKFEQPIQHYVNMQRYNKKLPAFLNCYYNINLVEAVQCLPHLGNQKLKLSKHFQLDKKDIKKQKLRIQDRLQNITIVNTHQIDKLNQDIFVNQYVFTKNVLGRGAHSVVRLAKRDNLNYAVKIIQFDKIRKKYFIKEDNFIKMINTQGRILRKLAHCENIVRLYQILYSIEKEKIFVILDYCENGTLLKIAQTQGNFNRKNKQKLEKWVTLVQAYFKQLANAVFEMHRNNIIHRDIKPENVLVNSKNIIKVIDFNISQQINEKGLIKIYTGKFTGTKGYAAPQLLISNGQMQKEINGPALDVWALGITLLQVLENKHPLECRSLETLQASIQKQIPLNVNYPEQLKKLLRGMLDKDSQRRWTIQDVLSSPWIASSIGSQNLIFQNSFKKEHANSGFSHSFQD